jgi:elongation factor Ts
MAEITLELIQELRQKTGIGMMDCKKALIETGGNLEKALELLRKKGADVAAKRSSNVTKHGLIHAYIHPGATIGVMVEISCETDFAAHTTAIKEFAHDVCLQIAAANPLCVDVSDLDGSLVEKEREIIKEQLKNSGKPAHLIEQIATNKLEKYYEVVCLMRQKFVKNDKLTIQDCLNEVIAKIRENIKIRRFVRYSLGN